MRYLLAFIPPERLDAVVEELADHHVHGLSISDARGFGQEHDSAHPEHHEHIGVDLVQKLRVEVVCQDHELEDVLSAFLGAAPSGRAGAGKVFVLPVLDVLRLKTGERGEAAVGPSKR